MDLDLTQLYQIGLSSLAIIAAMYLGKWQKSLGIILLLALYSAVWARPLLPLLSYAIHPAAYELNCENKARPQMHCHGKCQAMKAAAKQTAENKAELPKPPENLLHLAEDTLISYALLSQTTLLTIDIVNISSLYLELPTPPPRLV